MGVSRARREARRSSTVCLPLHLCSIRDALIVVDRRKYSNGDLRSQIFRCKPTPPSVFRSPEGGKRPRTHPFLGELCPCLLESPPGLSPLLASPPPFSALVARPTGGGQGGWVWFPQSLPQIIVSPSISPSSDTSPPAQTTPCSHTAPHFIRLSATVHHTRVRSSCASLSHGHITIDMFTSIFHHLPPPAVASHSPVPPTTSPP